jgi:L-ectoine synthase
MLVRTLAETKAVEWGNGLSRRFLLSSDGVGYTVTDTLVRAGSRSRLRYPHHIEACYCIAGSGWVIDSSNRTHRIEPGTLYALEQSDAHCLVADPEVEMRLVCVFAPALEGDEIHHLSTDGHSSYGRCGEAGHPRCDGGSAESAR